MATPNSLQTSGSESGQAMPGAFEGLPSLPAERLPGDFKSEQPVMALYYRTWMDQPELVEGRITDIWRDTRPFILRLPLGADFQRLVAQVVEESGGKLDTELLSKDPNPEPLRQHVLNADRKLMPSPGFVNLRTLQTPDNRTGRIIGMDITGASLIPTAAWPHVRDNEAYRTAWLSDGSDNLEDRRRLEQAISSYEQPVVETDIDKSSDGKEDHQPSRARRHISRPTSGKVEPHTPAYV